MYKEILRNITGVELFAVVGLLLFMFVFVAFAAYSVVIKKPLVKHLESLPLEDDSSSEGISSNRKNS
jgi:cytochrome c oxidase cbb3-type subunit IV